MSTLNFRQQPSALLSEVAETYGVAEALQSTPGNPRGYACLQASGADTVSFLQGQMTSDIAALSPGQCHTSALCNPKGRVIAQVEIARTGNDVFGLIMAHHLLPAVLTTLSRYILRAKVTLTPWPGQHLIVLRRTDSAPESGGCNLDGNGVLSCRPQWLPAGEPSWELANAGFDQKTTVGATDGLWAQAHVLVGIAPPGEATALEHIPQMLNLDALNAVSMTKGCYTGQEIIARVHHRGAVKRRLRRFVTDSNDSVTVGDAVNSASGSKAGMIVEVAHDDHQNLGVLAVIKESDFSPDAIFSCHDQALDPWPLPYDV